jgi:hypothetical protein
MCIFRLPMHLGLPLALKRLNKEHIQPIIARMTNQRLRWKADLLTRVRGQVHMQFVFTTMLIYIAMALDLPQWACKAIDKIHRNYFWRGHKEVRGGHYLVALDTVCHPIELGGLGISNLRNLGWARWLWLKKWVMLPMVCSCHSGTNSTMSFLLHGNHLVGWKWRT